MNPDAKAFVLIATAFGIFGALWFLGAMLRREWVKEELNDRNFTPLHIWWVPLAYWGPVGSFAGPAFKVIYLDLEERKHRAYCWTSNIQRRHVEWVKDEVVS